MSQQTQGHQVVLVVWIITANAYAAGAIPDCSNCIDGNCTFKGECLKGCVPGFADIHCKDPCPSNCINNTCHIDRRRGTFVCSDGCTDGYCGSRCNRMCRNNCTTCDRASCSVCGVKPCVGNRYGTECVPCPPNFERCDKDTGQCIKCKKGFYGENCEAPCPQCLFSDDEIQQECETGCDFCSSDPCPRNCHLNLCDKGSCLRGCKAGFHGVGCDLPCNDACAEKICAQNNGSCIRGYIYGYQTSTSGSEVDHGSLPVKIPIFVLLMALLSVCFIGALIAMVVIWKMRRNRLKHTQSPVRDDQDVERPLIINDKTKAEVLQRKTKDEINWRTKDMVRTTALSTVITKFEEGFKWITITGNPGDGKTTLAYLILQHFENNMDVFKLDSLDDYRHITWKKRDRMILLDDIFGAFTSDEPSIQRWIPVLRVILENHEQNGNAKYYDRIILTSRLNVVQDAQRFLDRYGAKILEEDRVIYLHKLDEPNERLKILECHLQKHNVPVHRQLKEETAKLKTHGFPYCCKLFSELKAKEKDINIVEFFKNPLTFLNETTIVLLKSTGTRQLFKNMIQYEEFDINSVEDDRERQKMLVAATAEEGSYIKRDSEGICHFTNDSIYQSVLSTLASEDPLFVAKFARLSDILHYITITNYDCNSSYISIKPLPSVLGTLGKRFETKIKDKNYRFFGERLCFHKLICEVIVTQCVYNGAEKIPSKLHIDTKDGEGITMVTTAAMFNNTAAVVVLVTNHADVAIADNRGRTPLHYLCGTPFPSTEGTSHRVDKVCIELVFNKEPNVVNRTDEDGRTPLDYLRERHGEERDLIEQLEAAVK